MAVKTTERSSEKVVPKHIFVTGGVASSLGKGLTASSLGRLLKCRGLRVTMQKLDPYINVDPGTMNPFEHGEVFVTDDGGETDLDLGHYERFIDENLSRELQRHDRLDLPGGARRRAPRRLPRQDRAGHPAHHRRDQAPHPPPRHRRRRRGHHRGRRHRRRHRDPARSSRPSGSSARTSAATTSATCTSRWCRSSARRASRRPSRPSTRSPSCAAGASSPTSSCAAASEPLIDRPEAQDLEPVRRRRARRRQRRRRPQHLRDPARPPRGGPRRRRVRHPAPRRAELDLTAVGGARRPGRGGRPPGAHRPHRQVRRPARRLPVGGRGLRHAGFHHGAKVEIDWIQAEDVEGLLAAGPPRATSTASSSPAASASAASRARSPPPATPASTTSRASGCASACRSMIIEFARNVLGPRRRQLDRVRPDHARTRSSTSWTTSATSSTRAARMRLGAYYAVLDAGLAGGRGLRRAGRVASATATATSSTPPTAAALRGRRLRCCRALSPDRRLVEFIELADHPFWVGTQAHPEFKSRPDRPHPLFRELIAAALARAEGRNPHLSRSTARSSCRARHEPRRDRRVPRFRRLGERTVHQGHIWRRRGRRRSRRPTATTLRPRHRPLAGRRRRRARCCSTPRAAVGGARAPVPAGPRRASCVEIPAGMRDVDGRDRPRRPPGASWPRRSGWPAGHARAACTTFHNSPGMTDAHACTSTWPPTCSPVAARGARPRGGRT